MAAPKKPKVTSSANRSKRSTTKPVTKGQNPQRANRQAASRATVSSSQNRPSGTGARVTTGAGSSSPKMVNADSPTMRQIRAKAQTLRNRTQNPTPRGQGPATRLPNSSAQGRNLPREGATRLRQQTAGTLSPGATARAQARGQAEAAKAQTRRNARTAMSRMEQRLQQSRTARAIREGVGMVSRGGAAAAGLQAYNTADGTLSAAMKRGDYKPKQGPAPKTTQSSFNKKSFDDAFRTARKSGAKQFSWRGKRYTTKMKGE